MTDSLHIDYDRNNHRAIFQVDIQNESSDWFQQLKRTLQDQTSDVNVFGPGKISAPWWSFINIREGIGAILFGSGETYSVSENALYLLNRASDRSKIFRDAINLPQLSIEDTRNELISKGWLWEQRSLTEQQMRNVRKLNTLPAGATFSVPGAGKTTEALAYYFLKAVPQNHLLVVAPKNAFGAWEEQLESCVGNEIGNFERLRLGRENIVNVLNTKPRFMLITYQQLARVVDIVANFISANDTFIFLDESHKIKSGRGRTTADAVLLLSHLPIAKLILSGTPMPQAVEDIIPQFEFLYPEITVTSANVIDQIQPIFVRTTKLELNLPPVNRLLINVPFNDAQKKLYDLMRSETARQAEQALNQRSRLALRMLGRSVMRLLEVVSNPSLLANDLTFLHQNLLSEVLVEGAAPKIRFACERARRLAQSGKKTLIWTTFRDNVESIADQLRDIGAVYIHGGVDAGDEDDDGTREGRIKLFKNDSNCFVMVANPAAASEGISLHKVCHHAIYIDRTYNAAHYLQSEDRIHRLGLLPDESPTIEILVCPGSIDENVQFRLETKVQRMATALNDTSLHIGANQYIPFNIDDDPESDSSDIDEDDIKSILDWLKGDS